MRPLNWALGSYVLVYWLAYLVVIGGVIVAPGASELIFPLTLAVHKGLTVNELASTVGVYPALSGSVAEAARRLMLHDDLD